MQKIDDWLKNANAFRALFSEMHHEEVSSRGASVEPQRTGLYPRGSKQPPRTMPRTRVTALRGETTPFPMAFLCDIRHVLTIERMF